MFFQGLAAISLATNAYIVLLLCTWSPASAQLQRLRKQQPNSAKSEPIGRLLSAGDRNKKKGSLIYPNDRLHPKEKGKKIKVLCYLNGKILKLGKGAVDDTANKCVRSSTEIKKCTRSSRSKCPKPKSSNTELEEPIVLRPYDSVVLNPHPSISWHRVPKATSYTVTLNGKGSNWKKQTKGTTLSYPAEENPMQSGNTYKLNVIANKGDSPFRSSSTVLVVLSDSEAQQIQSTIKQIQSLKLLPDEEARDIETIFRAKNLLAEAIEVLKKRIDGGTNNATIYRLLGDRYLEVGFPKKAKLLYIKATALARKANNANELRQAQAGLENAINSPEQYHIKR